MAAEGCLQLWGVADVRAGLDGGAAITLVLVATGSPEGRELAELARERGIPVREESPRDLWRMNRGDGDVDALALLRRQPDAALAQAMASDGPAWLLAGVSYPSNVGSAIRVIEVTGGAVVCVDGPFNRKARLRAARVAMRADRFIGVHWVDASAAISAAVHAGRQVIGIEDTGTAAPWEIDLVRPTLLVVGGEHAGIPPEVLAACHRTTRLPMPGFVPSYSVQSAVSIVAAEVLRQRVSGPGGGAGV